VLFFGDSYTLGTGASSPQAGYAPLTAAALGWRTDLEAVGGTGFVARAEEGLAYPQRAATLPVARPALVVVEGGLNDVLLREDPAAVAAAAQDTVALFRQRWPDVPLVVLGPVPVPKADRALLRDVDARLAAVVGADRYVSPRQLGWPISGYATDDGIHPDDAGYQVLADSFVTALRSLGS
jgi:lysophospholipase L1-like esterase